MDNRPKCPDCNFPEFDGESNREGQACCYARAVYDRDELRENFRKVLMALRGLLKNEEEGPYMTVEEAHKQHKRYTGALAIAREFESVEEDRS